MAFTYTTEGVILRRIAYRESDRKIVLLSPDHGKLDLTARGASKIVSKLAPHLEPYTYVRVTVASGNMETITHCQVKKRFSTFTTSLMKKAWVDYTAEVVDQLLRTRQVDPSVFRLVFDTWNVIDELPSVKKTALVGYVVVAGFVLKLLGCLGYRPELTLCARCGKRMDPSGNTFDSVNGALICRRCKKHFPQSQLVGVSVSTIKLLRFLLQEGYPQILRLKLNARQLAELHSVVQKYLGQQLNFPLRSVEFWRWLNTQPSFQQSIR
ncbi:MAG: DNA repair protein RecO [bacterium]|nr:DNA repair protein RecO [bacterium]